MRSLERLAICLLHRNPETVIAWHQTGFRLFWTWKVRRGSPSTGDYERRARTDPQHEPRESASHPVERASSSLALGAGRPQLRLTLGTGSLHRRRQTQERRRWGGRLRVNLIRWPTPFSEPVHSCARPDRVFKRLLSGERGALQHRLDLPCADLNSIFQAHAVPMQPLDGRDPVSYRFFNKIDLAIARRCDQCPFKIR